MFRKAPLWLGLFVLLLPLGTVLALVAVAWRSDSTGQFDWRLGALGLVVCVLAATSGVIGWSRMRSDTGRTKDEGSRHHYNTFLMGTGYALLLMSILCGVLVAGLIYCKRLPLTGGDFEKNLDSGQVAMLIVLSVLAAVVGALFFFANSLREKATSGEAFSAEKFWGGLWYRLGESVLFSLVVFWLVWRGDSRSGSEGTVSYTWLPIACLLIGMFVKSGEALMFAIAQGLFKAVAAFFGLTFVIAPSSELIRDMGRGQSGDVPDNQAAGKGEPSLPGTVPPHPIGGAISTTNPQITEPTEKKESHK